MKVKSMWLFFGLLIGFLSFFYWENLDNKISSPVTKNSSQSDLLTKRPINKNVIEELNTLTVSENSIALAANNPSVLGVQTTNSLDIINQKRTEAGLSTLSPSIPLGNAAQEYTALISGSNLSHNAGGEDLAKRVETAGYTGWKYLSENIASGAESLENAVGLWMASPNHRSNLLSPQAKDYGIGKNDTTWVVIFGAK